MSTVYNVSKGKDGDWTAGAQRGFIAPRLPGSLWVVFSVYFGAVDSEYSRGNPDHATVADIVAGGNEISGGSYARQDVTGRTVNVNHATNRFEHIATNPTFSCPGSSSPRWCLVYKAVASDADHKPVACVDLGTGFVLPSGGGDVTAKFDNTTPSGVVWHVE